MRRFPLQDECFSFKKINRLSSTSFPPKVTLILVFCRRWAEAPQVSLPIGAMRACGSQSSPSGSRAHVRSSQHPWGVPRYTHGHWLRLGLGGEAVWPRCSPRAGGVDPCGRGENILSQHLNPGLSVPHLWLVSPDEPMFCLCLLFEPICASLQQGVPIFLPLYLPLCSTLILFPKNRLERRRHPLF